jgi:hypothetical protein
VAASQVPFWLPGCAIDVVEVENQQMFIHAHTTNPGAECLHCNHHSGQVHSYYRRTIKDLPVSNNSVYLKVRIRRFRCVNPGCGHKTITERLPELVAPYAHRSKRLQQTLSAISFSFSYEAGACLTDKLRMKSSGDTLLRLIRRFSVNVGFTPRVVGDGHHPLIGHLGHFHIPSGHGQARPAASLLQPEGISSIAGSVSSPLVAAIVGENSASSSFSR